MDSFFTLISVLFVVYLILYITNIKKEIKHIEVDIDISDNFVSFKSNGFKICIEKNTKILNHKFTYIHTDGGVVSLDNFINNNQNIIKENHQKEVVTILILFIKQYIKE